MFKEEKLYPVQRAIELATGQRPHPSTCHRWRARGVGGVKLETQRCGGRRVTSVEAVRRFNERVSENTEENLNPTRSQTNKQRQQAILKAEQELDGHGI